MLAVLLGTLILMILLVLNRIDIQKKFWIWKLIVIGRIILRIWTIGGICI